MRYALGLLSGGIAALDHRLIAPNLSGSGETISTTRSWRVGRGFVKRRATPSLRNLLAGLRWPRSIPSKTARNREKAPKPHNDKIFGAFCAFSRLFHALQSLEFFNLPRLPSAAAVEPH